MNRWIAPDLLAAFEAAETTAHRLYTSPEAWVERLGADVLVSFKSDAARDATLTALDEWSGESGFEPERIFTRFIPRQNAERVAPVLERGDASASLESVVTEAGVRYGIDFAAGYSAGLFIDQRHNRALLQGMGPRRVLNTFAYTCSFSVVAALAGAETLSVDLSKKSLNRGRENFELNGISQEGHRFIADDVLDVLPRLERRGEKFDAIILDPPTFSRGRQGRRWQVEQGMEELLLAAMELAAPEALILLSTNCARLSGQSLERIARFGVKVNRLRGETFRESPLPDFPEGEGAQTLWLRLG